MMNAVEKQVHLAATDNINLAALAVHACLDEMSAEQKQRPDVQKALHAYRAAAGTWIAAVHIMMASGHDPDAETERE